MPSRGFRSAGYGNDVTGGLVALANRVQKARERAVPAIAIALVRQIKLELSQPGHGRVYLRGGGKVRFNTSGALIYSSGKRAGQFAPKVGKGRHVASAPGEPPAVDYGVLRASIDWSWVNGKVRVGSNIAYAPWLEFGTLGDGGRVAPRPFMRPAFEKLRPIVGTILRHAHNDLAAELGAKGGVR